MRILLLLTLFITFNSNASDNPEEKAVLAAHSKYYAARTDRDFATMVSMESKSCLLYTSPSPRDVEESRMPSSA